VSPHVRQLTGYVEEEIKAFLDKVAPEYRYRGDRFLRSAIDGAKSTPPS